MAAREQTSAIAARRGHAFQRAALSPDGDTAAVQDSSGVAYVSRSAGLVTSMLPAGDLPVGRTTGARIRSVHDPDGSVDAVAISAVVHLLATAGAGRAVHLWDAATGTPLGTVSDPGGAGVRSLAINAMARSSPSPTRTAPPTSGTCRANPASPAGVPDCVM